MVLFAFLREYFFGKWDGFERNILIGRFADIRNYLDVLNRPQIPGNTTWCFQYVMKRWYPVANLTRVRMATIYEQYQPGKERNLMIISFCN